MKKNKQTKEMIINRKNTINVILYPVFIIIYLLSLLIWGMGNSKANIRYFILVILIIFAFFPIYFKHLKKKKIYGKNLLLLIPLSILIIVVSYFKAKSVGYSLNIRTFVQTSLILLPGIYAFCFINIFDIKTIIKFMKFTLIATIVIYYFEGNHTIFDLFKASNWSFNKNNNFFLESNLCAGVFVQLYLFFNYFKRKKIENYNTKSLKIYTYIAFIFSLISFKRLGMVFVLFIAIINKFVNWDKKVPKCLYIIIPIIFTIATFFYTQIVQGTLFTNINVYKFTTGRSYTMSLWAATNYFSYGYGSCMLVINRYLEMDLVEMYIEMGLIITFLFCYIYFNMAKNKLYPTAIMSFGLLGLLFSSSLPSILTWILLFINVTLINSEKISDENNFYIDEESEENEKNRNYYYK